MASSKEDVDRPADSQSLPKNPYKDPDDGRQRFLLELEFVQCLANPTYIHYLAQNRYFEDEAFIGYLKYLQYWQRPEYIQFIMYPHCLFFLELLQNANFRNAMAHPGSKELAHRQQYYFWKNYRNNRLKHILPRPLPEPPAGPAPAPLPTAAPVPTSAPVPNAAPSLTPVSASLLAPIPPMSSGPVHSPMQFVGQPGSAVSAISKSDMRNAMGDRRKRKCMDKHPRTCNLRCYHISCQAYETIYIHKNGFVAQVVTDSFKLQERRLKGLNYLQKKNDRCYLALCIVYKFMDFVLRNLHWNAQRSSYPYILAI